jgi:glycosyltransferase involved in cell wall biosynthesis
VTAEQRVTSRRLLVITYHFPPDGSVGGLRWGGLAKYLARGGWEVHIVTAAAQPLQHPSGVLVHSPRPSRTLNDLYNEWATRIRARSGPPASAAPLAVAAATSHPAEPPGTSGMLGRMRRNLSTALAFPDYGRGWIVPAARTARALLREQPFDAVVTSGPPHSAHLAGLLATAGRREEWTVDMRDPWSSMVQMAWAQSAFRSDWVRSLMPRLERLVFERADRVVANTEEFAAELRAAFVRLPVACIPNGIDPERLPPRAGDKFAGLSIAYAGTLYAGRDLTPVVRAMRQFVDRRAEARGHLTLRVAGVMDAAHSERFAQEVTSAQLSDAVKVLGRIDGADALDLVNRSHVALVLAQDQPTQVPAKLYESVAMGVRTLVIAESTSAAAREARRIGADTCEPDDINGIRAVLDLVWSNRGAPVDVVSSIGYDALAKRMVAVLRGNADARVRVRRATLDAMPRT